jgi:para-aminobenzoate synthetase component 1
MGSMTGAPKIAAMEWIEQLEDFKRDWYSGTIGYVSPSEDFDFNVVIRSLIMDLDAKKLSYSAGGAITIDAVGEDEWKEVQLKKQGIETALSNLSL